MLHQPKYKTKIKVAELREALDIDIKGNEPWLQTIYDSFSERVDGSIRDYAALLTGHLRVIPIPGDVVQVQGSILYTPQIACGRCGDDIKWPVDAKIDVWYEDETTLADKGPEINLQKGDLERYFIRDGIIDLENLVNETIQMQISTTCVRETDDGSKCLVCDADLSKPIVYREDSQEEKISPFAELGTKNLKH